MRRNGIRFLCLFLFLGLLLPVSGCQAIWGRKKPSAEVASGKEVERSRDSLSKSHLKAEKKMAKQAAKSAKKAGRQ